MVADLLPPKLIVITYQVPWLLSEDGGWSVSSETDRNHLPGYMARIQETLALKMKVTLRSNLADVVMFIVRIQQVPWFQPQPGQRLASLRLLRSLPSISRPSAAQKLGLSHVTHSSNTLSNSFLTNHSTIQRHINLVKASPNRAKIETKLEVFLNWNTCII